MDLELKNELNEIKSMLVLFVPKEIITIEIKDNVYDKIIYFLKYLKGDVKIINEIESIPEKKIQTINSI